MKVPAKCYQVSERGFPERLEEIEYRPSDIVRKVQYGGRVVPLPFCQGRFKLES
ncbi:hypothetical protein MYX76_17195 [Desulfobacterota bacterium AH_259_B03_O07]|nr:hypothetical protein [Desulfobacterota bacterium AH_259_B03_O07]